MRKWVSVMHEVEIIEETPTGKFITYTAVVTGERTSTWAWEITVFDEDTRVVNGPSRFFAATSGDAVQFADEQLTRWGYTL